ncbi:MAG: DNA-binding protein [Acidimicrobiaceae bacterium]|nr:OB-fold domain-containing protein [Acidimicrobiaceae bacterium]MXW62473.1 DNA-binding protein [Acidimicrobiaceae bacterium]MYC43627.1 DNA-binding protein [Acidimicrobiaceae bacterium]MYH87260.1 DNA-binding protein [Acidimicrobiaceae bacterium]
MPEEVLQAPLVLEYPFTRTTGPVVGRFLTGLREGVVLGVRRSDGTVMCPPLEYDPADASPLEEMVELPQSGEVVSWSWGGPRREQQPFDQPVAWALIQLDGADTPMLHAVLVDGPEQMSTGMRVQIKWRDEREGHITDICGFVPESDETGPKTASKTSTTVDLDSVEAVQSVRTPIRLNYSYTPGRALSEYLYAMKDKRIIGDRCGDTGQVFVPPRGVSPVAGKATIETVDLPDVGYVESFNITRVPIATRPDLEPPYCSAWIVLDGASVGFMGLVINCEPESVRLGMRVRAVWKPDEELEVSATNILGWEPTGEADEVIADIERIGRVGPQQKRGSAS